ncbi:MAG: DUF5995 family protein [Bacteroidota bacterium]
MNLLHQPFDSIEDVVRGLTAFEEQCLGRRDLRGVFTTAYLEITLAIATHRERDGFADADWVGRYLVRFANLFREALLAYEEGRRGEVPKSWRIAFDAARDREGLIIQHLTLGINAHINYDLALALDEIGIDPGRPVRYADHTLVNDVLAGATDSMKHLVASKYAPILKRLDRLAGSVDDDLTNFSIPRAREHAWTMAVALAAAPSEMERRLILTALDEQAAVLARLILASPTRHPAFRRVVESGRRVDSVLRSIGSLPVFRRLRRRSRPGD